MQLRLTRRELAQSHFAATLYTCLNRAGSPLKHESQQKFEFSNSLVVGMLVLDEGSYKARAVISTPSAGESAGTTSFGLRHTHVFLVLHSTNFTHGRFERFLGNIRALPHVTSSGAHASTA